MLEKQPFKLPLAQGMNQKADPKTLTGGLTLVENGIYRKENEVAKRLGWTSLPRTLAAGGSLSSAQAGSTYENELLLWSSNRIYSYSEAQSQWYNRGKAYSAAVDTRQIISSNTSYGSVDSAYADGVVCCAYELGVTIRYQCYDYVTGAILQGDTVLEGGATCLRPKCVTISDYLFIIYSNASNEVKGAIINPATGAVTSTVTIASDLALASVFDVIAVATDTLMLVYLNNSGHLDVNYLNSSLTAKGGAYTDSTFASTSTSILRLVPLSSSRVMIAYVLAAQANVQARVVSSGGSVGSAIDTTCAKVTDGIAATDISGHLRGTAARIYVQYTAGIESLNRIWYADVSTVGGSNTSWEYLRSVGLATRGFVHEGVGFVGIFHKSELQSTFFIADEDGVIVARHAPGTGGRGAVNNSVSNVWSAVTGKYEYAISNKTRVIPITDTKALYDYSGSASPTAANLFSPLNVAVTSIDFQNNSNFSSAELGGTMLISGGVLSMYDGLSVVEHNFLLYPEGMTASSTSAGNVANGTYLYVAVYEWTDAKGVVHRSAPSVPYSHTVSAGPKLVETFVYSLRLTQKKELGIAGSSHIARAEVTIGLFRTLAGQTGPYYRVTSLTSPTENDTTANTIYIGDNLADSSLVGREILYTAGGVLDNSAAFAAKYIKLWRGRIVLAGLEDSVIQYSKPWARGYPVEFSAENTLEIESEGGPVKGLEVLDDKLVLFKEEKAFVTFGDGPDALGLGGSFSAFERISQCDVGCVDQQSTAAMPGAILFKSLKGYYILRSDMVAQYVGANVEDYNSLSVSSATLFASENEVRITNSDGSALVFNYFFQRWSVFTNYTAVDAFLWRGDFVHVRSDGKLGIETAGTWRDDASNYDVTLTSGWQALADLAGFQRIYRAQIVGEYKSPVALTLKAAFDNIDTWYESGSIALSAAGGRYQYQMKRQKCESVRFQIIAAVSETTLSGEAIKLTSMTLLFGIKRGMSKLANASKTGNAVI